MSVKFAFRITRRVECKKVYQIMFISADFKSYGALSNTIFMELCKEQPLLA